MPPGARGGRRRGPGRWEGCGQAGAPGGGAWWSEGEGGGHTCKYCRIERWSIGTFCLRVSGAILLPERGGGTRAEREAHKERSEPTVGALLLLQILLLLTRSHVLSSLLELAPRAGDWRARLVSRGVLAMGRAVGGRARGGVPRGLCLALSHSLESLLVFFELKLECVSSLLMLGRRCGEDIDY